MTIANAKPDLLITGPIGTTTVNAASSAWHDYLTVEAKITAAIAYAVSIGAKYCYVPDSFLPYTASLVTFNPAVKMIREGGNPVWSDVKAYGAAGDGVVDDGAAILAAIASVDQLVTTNGAGGVVYVPAGIYQLNTQLVLHNEITFMGATSRAAILRAASSFTNLTSTGLLRIGDGSLNSSFSVTVKDLQLELASLANSVGLYSSDCQSGCRFENVFVNNYAAYGFRFNGAGGAKGSVNEFSIRDCSAYKGVVGGVSGVGFSFEVGSYAGDISYLQSTSYDPANKVQAAYQVINHNVFFRDCYAESAGVYGFEFGNLASGGCLNCRVNDTGVTAYYHIASGAQRVTLINARSASAGTNVKDDNAPVTTISDAIVPLYISGSSLYMGNNITYRRTGSIVGPTVIPAFFTPTEAVLVSGVDANLGNVLSVTLTAARLVGAPLNPSQGQRLTFTLIQSGAGAFAVTWNAVFKKTWSDTGNVTGARSSISYIYDGTNWNQDGAQTAYV